MEIELARVLIVGMGKTGLSVARFLVKQGVEVSAVDSRDHPPELESLKALLPESALVTGGFTEEPFKQATHIVVSPGVSLDLPEIMSAKAEGKILLGDIDLFACQISEPVIAITGSNGKSTVTTLVGLMAEASGRSVAVGGNLGRPALDLLAEPNTDLFVLELSSFQLDSSHLLKPAVATVLNVSPDHMDRYQDFASYAASKQAVFKGADAIVLNRDDSVVMAMSRPDAKVITVGLDKPRDEDYGIAEIEGEAWLMRGETPLLSSSRLKIKGKHNLANALAALALGEAVDLPMTAMLNGLCRFTGLAHRMQWVAETDGIEWINDSKATNVGACLAALNGLSDGIVLIAGGDGKGADFSALVEAVRGKVRTVILIGIDACKLEALLAPVAEIIHAKTMEEAVNRASQSAQPGDSVLLSPACASQDQYRNYQHRGDCFVAAVEGLPR